MPRMVNRQHELSGHHRVERREKMKINEKGGRNKKRKENTHRQRGEDPEEGCASGWKWSLKLRSR